MRRLSALCTLCASGNSLQWRRMLLMQIDGPAPYTISAPLPRPSPSHMRGIQLHNYTSALIAGVPGNFPMQMGLAICTRLHPPASRERWA